MKLGERGELIVKWHEEKKFDRKKKIDHASKRDDYLGYDIVSFDADGKTKKYIEVKSSIVTNL